MSVRTIYLAEDDFDRLSNLLAAKIESAENPFLQSLEAELIGARVVAREKLPPDVVTMNSRVVYEDDDAQCRHEVTLVYPADANIDAGRVSVLTPMGVALLGGRAGASVDWTVQDREKRRCRIIAVAS